MTIGIAYGGMGRTQDEVVRIADEKLYFGKESGRNRIITEEIEDDKNEEGNEDNQPETNTNKNKNKKKNKSKKK